MIGYLLLHPSCLLGPKIWLSQQRNTAFHRKLFVQAWPNRARWQWFTLLAANGLLWYLVLGWWSIYKAFKAIPHDRNNWDLTAFGLFINLVYLVFWIGAPAGDFFAFGLNRVNRHSWLDFVYSSEELSWQRVFSCPGNAPSASLLNDKLQFEQYLRANAVPGTNTLCVIDRNSSPGEIESLPERLPVFLKPRSANSMRGCMHMHSENDETVLQGKSLDGHWVRETDRDRITALISAMAERQPLLVQSVLENSGIMSAYAGTAELVTLRLITGYRDNEAVLAYGILEIPEQKPGSWDLQVLNRSGESVLLGPVPDFFGALNAVKYLHREMNDIKTIAWDLCLTEAGWTVLEGNTGWGLVRPQSISGIPLLNSGLQDCY